MQAGCEQPCIDPDQLASFLHTIVIAQVQAIQNFLLCERDCVKPCCTHMVTLCMQQRLASPSHELHRIMPSVRYSRAVSTSTSSRQSIIDVSDGLCKPECWTVTTFACASLLAWASYPHNPPPPPPPPPPPLMANCRCGILPRSHWTAADRSLSYLCYLLHFYFCWTVS